MTSTQKAKKVMEKYTSYCFIGCKICNALYCFSAVTLASNFIFVKLITGELVLPFGFQLPWFDPLTFWGYTINLCYQLSLVFLCTMGYIFADSMYVIMVVHIYCIYDVLKKLLDDFDQLILSEQDNMEIEKELIIIINLHQKLLRFVVKLLQVIKYSILSNVVT